MVLVYLDHMDDLPLFLFMKRSLGRSVQGGIYEQEEMLVTISRSS